MEVNRKLFQAILEHLYMIEVNRKLKSIDSRYIITCNMKIKLFQTILIILLDDRDEHIVI